MLHYDLVIVGAGHAGAQAAISLRQQGFTGSLAMIGDEPHLPYERPPLSKDYFAGTKPFERILIRPVAFWQERNVDLLLGKRVTHVDPITRIVTAGGEDIGYGRLIWSAGGSARRLTCHGGDAVNVHAVRRRDDVDAIMAKIGLVEQITIIGGGYIGLEAAAVLSKFGKKIVLLEAHERVLARVAGPELSQFYENEHRAHGIDLRTRASVDCIEISDGVATAVIMANGERIPTDLVIVGIGIVPETLPLIAAGAAGDNGINVDEHGRTSLSDIYAIGDCAAHTNRFANGTRIRLESVQNANDQAKAAAAHIVGTPQPYDSVPWFWSNQYDLRLQTVGLSIGHDHAVMRGLPSSRSFSVVYLREGKVIALDCVNATKDYVQGRALVEAGLDGFEVSPADLQDTGRPLKSLLPGFVETAAEA